MTTKLGDGSARRRSDVDFRFWARADRPGRACVFHLPVFCLVGLLAAATPGIDFGGGRTPTLVAPALGATLADRYHDDGALRQALRDLAAANPRARMSTLASSAGGREMALLTIVPAHQASGSHAGGAVAPAILVIGDPLGMTPLATEAALLLAARLLDRSAEPAVVARAAEITWYIVPRANPDGAARFFDRPRLAAGGNARPVDDDRDGLTDEDGADDLDGDGLISVMLRPHPSGEWILTSDDPPLPKLADPTRGERGLYQRLSEGRDDDGDGLFNEDGPGGVVPGRNFPHAFEYWRPAHGVHPASEPESRALLRFATEHPEIALVLVFGPTNNLTPRPQPPASPKPEADNSAARRLRVPERLASEYGFDPLSEYSLEDLVISLRTLTRNKDLASDEVLRMLRPGPALEMDAADLPWWNALASAYADSLRAVGLGGPRVAPLPSLPGCVEDWAYFQLGVPALAIDFWSVPGVADVRPAGNLAAGALLDPVLAPVPSTSAPAPSDSTLMVSDSTLSAGLPAARLPNPDEQALARFSRQRSESGIYAAWREISLAGVGKVLIGGPMETALRNPPAVMLDSLLTRQMPFLLALPEWLPRLEILALACELRGHDVYEVTAHLAAVGRIPYPTAQGGRTRRPPPVVVTVTGADVIEGRARRSLPELPAGGAAEVRWLVRGRAGGEVVVEAGALPVGTARRTARLGAAGGPR